MARMRWSILWLCVPGVLLVGGCSLLSRAPRPVLLANALQDIVPHGDRDHFVYIWQRFDRGQVAGTGIQVEHVTAVGGGEFEVLLSEDGVGVGRTRLRDTGDELLLLREDDLSRGLRLTYDPPLPQLSVPLFPGEQRASASANVTRLADGQPIGTFPVEQLINIRPGPPTHSGIGSFPRSVLVQVVRTVQGEDETDELNTESVLVPGIGELSSTGEVPDAPLLHRKLACAIIAGRRVGDCTHLPQVQPEPSEGVREWERGE